MRFFVSNECIRGDSIVIGGEDARHISYSLRCRVGELLTVCGEGGLEYACKISDITKDTVFLTVTDVKKSENESAVRVHLFQAMPKGEKAELIVQKAVELGVYDIAFVQTERCIVKLDGKSAESKRARYEKIAKAASEQCGRAMIPKIIMPVSFESALHSLGNACNIFCYEGGGTVSLKKALRERVSDDINVFIGPEGGWSEKEYELSLGFCTPVNLGKRILRCETSPLFVLSSVVYECEL